jgi:hypothetical protein
VPREAGAARRRGCKSCNAPSAKRKRRRRGRWARLAGAAVLLQRILGQPP